MVLLKASPLSCTVASPLAMARASLSTDSRLMKGARRRSASQFIWGWYFASSASTHSGRTKGASRASCMAVTPPSSFIAISSTPSFDMKGAICKSC